MQWAEDMVLMADVAYAWPDWKSALNALGYD